MARWDYTESPTSSQSLLPHSPDVVMSLLSQLRKTLLTQPEPTWHTTSPVSEHDAHISITYLGTAGFVIQNAERSVVLDPYVTRTPLVKSLTKPLIPQVDLIKQHIPRADDVVIGHSHYDHILDAPDLCKQTGARLIGSPATMMVGRAAGLPESQLLETTGREDIASGDWRLRGLPSVHGKVAFGRIPISGDISQPPPWPPRMLQLKHGLVLNWLVDTGQLTIVHIDSADFIEDELRGIKADIVCLCAIGRRYRPNYVADVVRLLRPTYIIPCHWDTMMTPIDETPDLIPTVNLPQFFQEIKDAGATPLFMPLLGKLHFGGCSHDH